MRLDHVEGGLEGRCFLVCAEIHDGLTHFLIDSPLLKFFLGYIYPCNHWGRHLVVAGELPVPVREQ